MTINKKRPMGKDVVAVNIVGCILIGVFAFICVVPFYLVIVASFTSNQSIIQDGYPLVVAAKNFSLQSYQLCLKNPTAILQAYGMTILVTLIGTFCAVMMACMTGYVLSRITCTTAIRLRVGAATEVSGLGIALPIIGLS